MLQQPLGKPWVFEGLTDTLAKQLIKYTNSDPLILETTKDIERFKDQNSLEKWLKKERNIYTLVDSDKNLMGIIWLGKKQMPKNIHYSTSLNIYHYSITFAIRLYEHARGKGLSHKFIKQVWEMYSNADDYLSNPNKGLWLETNINNFAAVSAYKKVGFKLVSKPDKAGKIIMLQS